MAPVESFSQIEPKMVLARAEAAIAIIAPAITAPVSNLLVSRMIILPSSRGVALRALAFAEAICVPAQNNFLKQRVDSFGLTPSAPVVKLPEAPGGGGARHSPT
jgi:hypothetical protein